MRECLQNLARRKLQALAALELAGLLGAGCGSASAQQKIGGQVGFEQHGAGGKLRAKYPLAFGALGSVGYPGQILEDVTIPMTHQDEQGQLHWLRDIRRGERTHQGGDYLVRLTFLGTADKPVSMEKYTQPDDTLTQTAAARQRSFFLRRVAQYA